MRKQLVADGWTEVATGLQWEEFLRDAERSALVYPTGDDPQGKVARQLTHSAELAPRPLKQVCLRVPWQPLHVEEYPEVTSCGVALRLFGIWRPGDHPFAWYTFSQDPSGRERKRFEKVLKILFTGYAGRVEKSMACIATAATLAVRPSTLRGTSTNTPRTGYVPIVKTKYRSSGPFAIVESGGRGAHRSSIMVKPQKTASSQKGLQLPRWCSTGGRW